jgi:nucleotide-binding universal stress UspA family protein
VDLTAAVDPAGPVVAGFDDSPASFAAAAAAAELARLTGAPLRLVRAWPADAEPGRAAARQRLDRAATSVATSLPDGAVTAALRSGPPDLVLRDESRAARLLVIGAAGEVAMPGAGLGPVAAALVRRSACPVLLHREAAGGQGVLAGADGGPGTARLLTAAAAGAALRGMPLLILHAWSGRSAAGADDAAVSAAEQRFLEGYVAPLRETWPEVAMEVRVVHDRPEAALLDAARTAALVVLGRRDAPARHDGATVATVAAAAPGSVLVVPLTGSDRGADASGIRRRPVALT